MSNLPYLCVFASLLVIANYLFPNRYPRLRQTITIAALLLCVAQIALLTELNKKYRDAVDFYQKSCQDLIVDKEQATTIYL